MSTIKLNCPCCDAEIVIETKEEAAAATTAPIARDEDYWKNIRQGEIGQPPIQDDH